MTTMRVLDTLLALGSFVMAGLSAHPWSIALWIVSGLYCAASAYWCWTDRTNAWLKRYLAKTSLGWALRIRAGRL